MSSNFTTNLFCATLNLMPKKIFFFFLFLMLTILHPALTQAASGQCLKDGKNLATASWPDRVVINSSFGITVNFTNQATPGNYYVLASDGRPIGATDYISQNLTDLSADQLRDGETITYTIPPITTYRDKYYIKLQKEGLGDVCNPSEFGIIEVVNLSDIALKNTQCSISTPSNTQIGNDLNIELSASNSPSPNSRFIPLIFKSVDFSKISKNVYIATGVPLGDFRNTLITPQYLKQDQVKDLTFTTSSGTFNQIENFTAAMAVLDDSSIPGDEARLYICGAVNFSITNNPTTTTIATPIPSPPSGAGGVVKSPLTTGHVIASASASGIACSIFFGGDRYQGIGTAIGCIPVEPVGLVRGTFAFILSIGGGIAFLIMIMGVFRILTSAGNPDQLKNGTEMLTNAIIGILLIVFSILILQIIGVGILNIPGFS